MRIDKDLVAASATPLVLGILSDGDLYGYAILKRVGELSGGGKPRSVPWNAGKRSTCRSTAPGPPSSSWSSRPSSGSPDRHCYCLSALPLLITLLSRLRHVSEGSRRPSLTFLLLSSRRGNLQPRETGLGSD